MIGTVNRKVGEYLKGKEVDQRMTNGRCDKRGSGAAEDGHDDQLHMYMLSSAFRA